MLELCGHNDSIDALRDPQNTVFSYQFHVTHHILFHSVSSRRRASNRAVHFCLKEATVAQFWMSAGRLLKHFGPEIVKALAPASVLLNSVSMLLSLRVDRWWAAFRVDNATPFEHESLFWILNTLIASLSSSRSWMFSHPSFFKIGVTWSLFRKFPSWATFAVKFMLRWMSESNVFLHLPHMVGQ